MLQQIQITMKKIFSTLAFLALTLMAFAQDFAKMDKSVMDAAYFPANATKRAFAKTEADKMALTPKIRVLYSRPTKKGRVVFGELLKFGEPWRIGANESTEVLFMTDVKFGDTPVKAGRYSLIAVPTKDNWTLHLNSELDGWGNYSYDAKYDVATVTVPTQMSKDEIEALSIALYEKSPNVVHMKIGWDKTFVEVPVMLKDTKGMKDMKSMKGKSMNDAKSMKKDIKGMK